MPTCGLLKKHAFSKVFSLRTFVVLVFALTSLQSATANDHESGTPPAEKKPILDKDLARREEMLVMSRQLGVTCNHCHDPANFRDGKLKNFQIAKEHMRVVEFINSPKGWSSKPKVDCYTCHKGSAKFEYKEKLIEPESHSVYHPKKRIVVKRPKPKEESSAEGGEHGAAKKDEKKAEGKSAEGEGKKEEKKEEKKEGGHH